MKRGILDHFRKSVPFANLLKDAPTYEAKPGQNLGDYCFKKLMKLRALKLSIPDEFLIDAVIEGPNIKAYFALVSVGIQLLIKAQTISNRSDCCIVC